MSSTFMATTAASTSYFLQQFDGTTGHSNATRSLIQASSPIFHHNTGAVLSPEEEYFYKILMKFQQPSEMASRTRLISVQWSAVVGTFFICSTLFGLIGNAAVIIAIAGDKIMRRSAMNILLLNLAVADMLNLITIILEWSPAVYYGYPAWDFPAFLCPLARYLECAFLFASILTQLVVCIERFIAIVYPIHTRRLCTRQNILLLTFSTWIVAFIFSLPYALVHIKPKASIKCVNPYNSTPLWVLYKWFEFLAGYALPCGIMIWLYARISCTLWSKNSHLGLQRPSALDVDKKTRFEVLDQRRGIIKMLVACVLVYFVSYSPIQGIFLSGAMFGPGSRPPYSVVLLLNALACFCSASNPVIYTLFSKKFRSRIIHLLTCGKRGQNYSRNDITYSFAKKPKKHKSCSLEADHSVLLQSNLTPDTEARRYVTLTSNSPM